MRFATAEEVGITIEFIHASAEALVPRLPKASRTGFLKYIRWMYFATHQSVLCVSRLAEGD